MLFQLTGYIASNGRLIVNGELKKKQKEAVMACFKVLSQHLTGRNEPRKSSVRYQVSILKIKPETS
jgi:hypothetical protein